MRLNGAAKLIEFLPEPLVVKVAKKIANGYIDKYANINVDGLNNISKSEKPKIFVCNHLSNSDGLVLNRVLKDYEPTFVAGVKLSDNPITTLGIKTVKHILIKPNTADKESITAMVEILRSGKNLLIFPEGTRSRSGKMIEGKKGVLLIAKMGKADIVPISMWGTEKLLPINKDDNMSHEKWNYADVNLKISEPVKLPIRSKEESKHIYDERCMEIIMRNIADNLPEQYRGVYGKEYIESV